MSEPGKEVYEVYTFPLITDDAYKMAKENAEEWRAEGYEVDIDELPTEWRITVYAKPLSPPEVRGEKRYGAAKAGSEEYLGFGGHKVKDCGWYYIYCIGTTDANWQWMRLSLESLSNATYLSAEEVEEFIGWSYPKGGKNSWE